MKNLKFAAMNVISHLGGRGDARERKAGEKLEGQNQSIFVITKIHARALEC